MSLTRHRSRVVMVLIGASTGLALLSGCSSGHGEPTDPVSPAAIELPSVGDALPASASAVLEAPDALEILALHPYPHELGPDTPESARFHGYGILGRAALEDPLEQRRAVALVYEAVATHPGMFAACFNPRHGVRATKSGETVDLVICFECLTMQVNGPGAATAVAGVAEGPEPRLSALYRGHGLAIHSD